MGTHDTAVGGFDEQFVALTGVRPFLWQRRLFAMMAKGEIPSAIDLPTGLGKTSVMAIWLIARAHGADLPRRLVYVVDRRAVVDQATDEALKLRRALEGEMPAAVPEDARRIRGALKEQLGLDKARELPISTLRGAFVDNREWLEDPAIPAIVVGTVDMIGSRLLFEGYGVSRRMRPYHAGLLGVDALIVLDEAHLVPPFAHLLRSVEQEESLRAQSEQERRFLPRFFFLPLSATQRDTGAGAGERATFGLEEEDWNVDDVARKRIAARKRLRLEPLTEKDPDRQFAEAAWALACKDGEFSRIAIFCDRRDKTDEAGGPSVSGVKAAIEKLADGGKKAKRHQANITMLVGGRRVYERTQVADSLRELGFTGEKRSLEKPAFLLATSAGEVGVDIDADHMVCDLVAWERMVQRLGRVNRRGEGDAEITVFWREPSAKKPDAPTEAEQRALRGFKAKAAIERLPLLGDAYDASPGALRHLAEDDLAKPMITAATTQEPLRPGLDRAMLDAWSMTSLEVHTGRPEVAPWLRGWIDEERPQTTVIWRRYMPIPVRSDAWTLKPRGREIEEFFEAARPHESEKLETETYRVTNWLQARAASLLAHKASRLPALVEVEAETRESGAAQTGASQAIGRPPAGEEVVALIISPAGNFLGCHSLEGLGQERKGRAAQAFERSLVGNVLVIDARFAGLVDGLLSDDGREAPRAVDSANEWSREAGFRVRLESRRDEGGEVPDETPDEILPRDWRFELDFVVRRDEEDNPSQWLRVEHLRNDAQREDARSISRPQELAEHQEWTRRVALRIGEANRLSGAAAQALAVAAALHDEGKKAARWQRAFNAARDTMTWKLAGPLAKTRGPIDQAMLDGYRHEFGSLPFVEKNAEFNALPEEWRDLVLHLVAAHHGQARPVIETRGCEDGPPSMLQERARAVALRFARLQRRWGPWGLAWWEALLRAADQQASRENDRRPAPDRRMP